MNCSVYIFGNLGDGYTQYPNDYAKEIYQKFYSLSRAKSQIITHRDNNLIYYGYIRKLDGNSQYIGFCILLNGIVLTEVNRLYPIFEAVVTDLVSQGEILQFDNKGDIVSLVTNLSLKERAVGNAADAIRHLTESLEPYVQKLPPVSYDIANNECKIFKSDDNPVELFEAIHKYAYTSILKDAGYDSETLSSYRNTLKRIINEKTIIQDKYLYLDNQYKLLEKQKKQYKWVSILAIVIILCLVGLYLLNTNLTNTITGLQGEVRDLQEVVESKENHITLMRDTIIDQRHGIHQRDLQITGLNSNLASYRDSLQLKEASISSLESELASCQASLTNAEAKYKTAKGDIDAVKGEIPILISSVRLANTYQNGNIETDYGNTLYSSRTMFITPKITYKGLNTGNNINLKVKFYTPNNVLSRGSKSPTDFSYESTLYVFSGTNTATLSGWGGTTKGHWGKGSYRIEIWYEDVCLKAKNFTIY